MKRKEKRTYADRREYMIRAVSERRRKVKAMALEYMGGKCQVCGYNKHQGVLDFHHVDPRLKVFAIGTGGHSRSWERVRNELAKCILVCANCHREIEMGIAKIPSRLLKVYSGVAQR